MISSREPSQLKRGKALEYRVIAINKAGDGEPSNTVILGFEICRKEQYN